MLLESIPMAVPDSNILGKAAYKTGEAWYQAAACAGIDLVRSRRPSP